MVNYEDLYTQTVISEMNKKGIHVPLKEKMTCNRCPEIDKCPFAWDLFNINGDCLAMK